MLQMLNNLCVCVYCLQAGIIDEMLEDTFESMEDEDEMEEAAEMEIDKILFEVTAGKLNPACMFNIFHSIEISFRFLCQSQKCCIS